MIRSKNMDGTPTNLPYGAPSFSFPKCATSVVASVCLRLLLLLLLDVAAATPAATALVAAAAAAGWWSRFPTFLHSMTGSPRPVYLAPDHLDPHGHTTMPIAHPPRKVMDLSRNGLEGIDPLLMLEMPTGKKISEDRRRRGLRRAEEGETGDGEEKEKEEEEEEEGEKEEEGEEAGTKQEKEYLYPLARLQELRLNGWVCARMCFCLLFFHGPFPALSTRRRLYYVDTRIELALVCAYFFVFIVKGVVKCFPFFFHD